MLVPAASLLEERADVDSDPQTNANFLGVQMLSTRYRRESG